MHASLDIAILRSIRPSERAGVRADARMPARSEGEFIFARTLKFLGSAVTYTISYFMAIFL